MKLQTTKQVKYIESDRVLQPESVNEMLLAYNEKYGSDHYDTIVVGNGLTFWKGSKNAGYCGWYMGPNAKFEMDKF